MKDLLAKLEAATEGEQYDLITEALRYAFEHDWIMSEAYVEAVDWASSGAYLSAAVVLVPEGMAYTIRENCTRDGDEVYCNAQVWPYSDPRDEDAPVYWANSPEKTPALAVTIASLKAHEHKGTSHDYQQG